MGGPIRAFFAVEINDKKLIYAINKVQKKLSSIVDRLKLVELENIHITLRFLGDISEITAEKLYQFLEERINPVFFEDGPIEFSVHKLSDFSKRVFHLGLKGPVSILREIHDKIDEELVNSFGFPADNKFKSHITIARARERRNKGMSSGFPTNEYNLLKQEYGPNNSIGSFKISKVYLKRSVLTPQGPIYSNLEF